jgi:transcriptional regulator with XRE-family HTH domain
MCDTCGMSQGFEKSLYQAFGSMLAAARKRRKKSQQALADELGLTRTSITNIEKGRQRLQLHTLYLIARSLKLEVTDLLPSPAALKSAQPNPGLSVSDHEWLRAVSVNPTDGGPEENVPRRGTSKKTDQEVLDQRRAGSG